MTCALEPGFGKLNILFVDDKFVRSVRSSRENKVSQNTDGDGNNCTNNVHPSPTSQAMNTIKSRRSTCLNQACCKRAEGESDVETTSPTSNLVTSVPGTCIA